MEMAQWSLKIIVRFQKNGYSILKQRRAAVSLFDTYSKTYKLNWHGREASFLEKDVIKDLKSQKNLLR